MADAVSPLPLARSSAQLLRRVLAASEAAFAAAVAPSSLTLHNVIVLATIAEYPEASQGELARAAGVDDSTFTDLVKRLETRGLIARETSGRDARAKTIRLSPLGKDVLLGAAPYAAAADALLLESLPKGKRKAFLEALLRLGKALDERAEREAKQARKLKKRELKAKKKAQTKPKPQRKAALTAARKPKRPRPPAPAG